MKDKLLDFGTVTIATANTYAAAANVLNMGATTKTGNVDQANVVARYATAPAASGTVKLKVTTGATSSLGTTLAEYTFATDGVKKVFAAPLPKEHKQFVGLEGTGSATGSFTAAIELGA